MKLFIITDERCGGTVFTNIFKNVFNLKTICDPQTGYHKKFPGYHKSMNLLDYMYNILKYDVVVFQDIIVSCIP